MNATPNTNNNLTITVLGKVGAWNDGIPCYSSIMHFANRQKAEEWLQEEYGEDWKEWLNTPEEIEKAESSCSFSGPEGYDIWEADVRQ